MRHRQRRYTITIRLWLFGWLLIGCGLAAHALAQPSETPFLRIEVGMHTARINRIDVDRAERFLVTASFDKTARVWRLADGELLQVLRPPIGDGDEGKLYAVAISPDGATVATAGWSEANDIYLFDRASGRLAHRITGLPNVINHLAYSADGRYLAAALGRSNGIRIYDARSHREIARDTDYGSASYWIEFDPSGRVVTSSYDGYVRLYDNRFKRIARRRAPGGQRPYAVRFSPDDARIVVGFEDNTAVNILSGENLTFLYAPDTEGIDNGNLG